MTAHLGKWKCDCWTGEGRKTVELRGGEKVASRVEERWGEEERTVICFGERTAVFLGRREWNDGCKRRLNCVVGERWRGRSGFSVSGRLFL